MRSVTELFQKFNVTFVFQLLTSHFRGAVAHWHLLHQTFAQGLSRSKARIGRNNMIVEGKAAARKAEGRIFRWLQLAMGIVCMAMIANLQYGWTLFVDPIDAKYHWGRAAIQLAFTLFVLTETWLVPVEAWFVDKYGPRVVVMFGGVMITLAWVLNSYADSLLVLYLAAIVGGIGAGSVYGTCVGNALKWFPHRRGLAAGATAAGLG